jgi:hypothetical protein
VPHSSVLGLTLLLIGLQPPQFPSVTVKSSPHPPVERRLPIDQPEVITPRKKPLRVEETLLREANELANLADEVPPSVLQASKGLLSKDLDERLKRIEKLSKHLRRELRP